MKIVNYYRSLSFQEKTVFTAKLSTLTKMDNEFAKDVLEKFNGQYEKNILLNLSKYMSNKLNEQGILSELVRNNDVSLTDEERKMILEEFNYDVSKNMR